MAAAWLRRWQSVSVGTNREVWGFERTRRGVVEDVTSTLKVDLLSLSAGTSLLFYSHQHFLQRFLTLPPPPLKPARSRLWHQVWADELPQVSLVSSHLSYLLITKRWVLHASKGGRRIRGSDQEKLTWSEYRDFPERERSGNRKVRLEVWKKICHIQGLQTWNSHRRIFIQIRQPQFCGLAKCFNSLKMKELCIKKNLSFKQTKPAVLLQKLLI